MAYSSESKYRVDENGGQKQKGASCSKTVVVIIVILFVIILLAVTGILIWYFAFRDSKDDDSDNRYSVIGTVTLENDATWTYSSALSDPSSAAFGQLQEQFCQEIESIEAVQDGLDSQCRVSRFRAGSLVVEFTISFARNSSDDEAIEAHATSVRQGVFEAFSDNEGSVRRIPFSNIDLPGLSVTGTYVMVVIDNISYSNALENKNSEAFRQMEEQICSTVPGVANDTDTCFIMGFSEGSLVAYIAYARIDQNQPTSSPQLAEEIRRSIQNNFLMRSFIHGETQTEFCRSFGCNNRCDFSHPTPQCECSSGYVWGSSMMCLDVNECLENTGGCSHTCTNTNGSYICSCSTGYTLSSNQHSCVDVNECQTSGICEQLCNNTMGSYSCYCARGYEMSDGRCQDMDECMANNGGCSDTCRNTDGSYRCSCTTGYILSTDRHTCVESTCTDRQFDCGDGHCISGDQRCDGEFDCTNLMDERSCTCTNPNEESECTLGPCIDNFRWCDGVEDCLDGSDEDLECASGCPVNTIQCYSDFRKFTCLSISGVCNGFIDCFGGSDEQNCDCPGNSCHWGKCLIRSKICDGTNDCMDWSDEVNCESGCDSTEIRCNAEELTRSQGDFYCLPLDDYGCDRARDCPEGEDETLQVCEAKRNIQACHQELSASEMTQYITSPNYPQNYPNNAECIWIIRAPIGSSITINFLSVDMEREFLTCVDAVAVLDAERNVVWQGCITRIVTVPGNYAIVVFYSDESLTDWGFRASYSSALSTEDSCDVTLNVTSVQHSFTSPGYPRNYPNNQQCVWILVAPAHHFINITFVTFDLEDSFNNAQCVDFVAVLEYDEVIWIGCGNQTTFSLQSHSSSLFVAFISDLSVTNRGFRANYFSSPKPTIQPNSSQAACLENEGFLCDDGCCIHYALRCDGPQDCADGSDEFDCGCERGVQFECADNGRCFSASKRCDGVNDCQDYSDEWHCECPRDKWMCSTENRCLPQDWRCDGEIDCQGGQDEQGCGQCGGDQLQCSTHECIRSSQSCDGIEQCREGSDEAHCLQFLGSDDDTGVVTVRTGLHSGVLAVCSTNWNLAWSHVACRQLGFGHADSYETIPIDSAILNSTQFSAFLEVATTINQFNIILGASFEDTCSEVVSVSCSMATCGRPQAAPDQDFVAKVVNGEPSNNLAWPWMASLHIGGAHGCGGSILNSRYILTAAHCTNGKVPQDYKVHVGSVDNTAGSVYNVVEIHQHANYTETYRVYEKGLGYSSYYYDIALLRLERDLIFSTSEVTAIAPICLPPLGADEFKYRRCYVTGWGQINPIQGAGGAARFMHQGKLNLLTLEHCRTFYEDTWSRFPFHVSFTAPVYDSHVCAGQTTGHVDACYGDSGGPLSCEDHNGNWHVLGLVSSGPILDCLRFSLYERVAYHLDWINNIIN